MARSKQKTVGQQVIGVAAVGMPSTQNGILGRTR